MKTGLVRMWDEQKGFGFILSDDDEDLFVHVSDLDPRVKGKRLRQGQRVAFDVRREFKGDRAVHVRILERQ